MINRNETDRPSPQQEGLNVIAGLLGLAQLNKNPTSLIRKICEESGLSPKGNFAEEMIKQAQQLREENK